VSVCDCVCVTVCVCVCVCDQVVVWPDLDDLNLGGITSVGQQGQDGGGDQSSVQRVQQAVLGLHVGLQHRHPVDEDATLVTPTPPLVNSEY